MKTHGVLTFAIVLVVVSSTGGLAGQESAVQPPADEPNTIVGAAPGFLFAHAWGRRSYVAEPYVDGFGFVQVRRRLEIINRVLFSMTGYVKPFAIFDDAVLCAKPDRFACIFFVGVTVGYTQGSENKEFSQGAIAWGVSIGMTRSDTNFFGIFLGTITDPTVQKIASPLMEGGIFPGANVRRTGTADDYLTNAGIVVPSKSVNARYETWGLIYSRKLKWFE